MGHLDFFKGEQGSGKFVTSVLIPSDTWPVSTFNLSDRPDSLGPPTFCTSWMLGNTRVTEWNKTGTLCRNFEKKKKSETYVCVKYLKGKIVVKVS